MRQLKKINYIIAVLFIMLTIALTFVLHDDGILLYLLIIPVPFILKLKPVWTFHYLLFTFISVLLGGLCQLYKKTIWFDSFSHFVWGFLSGLIAIDILDKMRMYDKKRVWFNMVFIFIFSLATSGLWEICEFTVDNLFGLDMQRNIGTGVFDTMKDIIVAFIGNIVFLLWYGYEYFSNHKGYIQWVVDNMDKK